MSSCCLQTVNLAAATAWLPAVRKLSLLQYIHVKIQKTVRKVALFTFIHYTIYKLIRFLLNELVKHEHFVEQWERIKFSVGIINIYNIVI